MGYGIPDQYSDQIVAALKRDAPQWGTDQQIMSAFTDAYHRYGGFSDSSDYGRIYNLVRHQLNDSYGWGLNEDWQTFNAGTPGGAGVPGFSEEEARQRWIARDNPYGGDDGFLGMGDLGNLLAIGGLGLTGFGLAGMGPLAGLAGAGTAAGAGAGLDLAALGSWDAVGGLTAAEAAALGGGATAAGAGGGSIMFNPNNMTGTGFTGNLADYGFGPSVFGEGSVVNAGGMTIGDMTAATAAEAATPGFWESVKAAGALGSVKSLIDGGGTIADLTKLLGAVAPAALGYIGAKDQQDSLAALGEKYFNVGAPSRARYEASFAPGFTMAQDAGYKDALDQTTKSTLYSLSPGGNPVGSPNAWTQTLKDVNAKFAYPALQDYRRTNASAGGLAALSEKAPTLETAAVNAGKSAYDAVGAGASDVFFPRKSLADLLREAGVRP